MACTETLHCGDTRLNIDARENFKEFRLRTETYPEKVELIVRLESDDKEAQFADEPIPLLLRPSLKTLGLVAIAVATVAGAKDYSFIASDSWLMWLAEVWKQIPLLKVFWELTKLAAMIGLFVVFGKKLI